MILFKKAIPFSDYIKRQRASGLTVGFVPTMGALHNGHLTLIEACKKRADITVCSIFVNPTQFNNASDFTHYPSTIEQDIHLLIEAACDVLFFPEAAEIYPAGYVAPHYPLGKIETILEGTFRPGHFQGVCQAVDRLVSIVEPHKVYFGQKDYQQCIVIKKLLAMTGREEIELNIVPTVREETGLAMSSRNLRLTAEQRAKAAAIYDTLTFLKAHIGQTQVMELKTEGQKRLQDSGFNVDYVEIADAKTLEPVATINNTEAVALIAAAIGDVRLIDNMQLN